ncbi:hypothetical protein CXG81DRAFT_18180 [Caulochytrium protostelioides]|uniref:Microtubule-associated protein Jupiter n=1 Tax=Caulochytrium protostelioides TaxID=1555241 RepID=A0A4P9XAH9_9FUNG|nr:hypothetical protein CXG81DRAFT_18180 [Caulochytrium protostelioides]|eukprot:RKP02140.1 hypothetical protein CXG81DRAFT_18180 [Caulochytrium protostelioides]
MSSRQSIQSGGGTDLAFARPSTRLHAPPGGQSSNIFGTDASYESAPVRGKRSQQQVEAHQAYRATQEEQIQHRQDIEVQQRQADAHAYAERHPQGASISVQSGGGTDLAYARPSTRLHAPPGGKSSNIFGSDEALPGPHATQPERNTTARGQAIRERQERERLEASILARDGHHQPGHRSEANRFGNNTNNHNTAQGQAEPQSSPEFGHRASSRGSNPPGGRTTFTFG